MGSQPHVFFASSRKMILTIACALLVGVALGLGIAKINSPHPDVFVSAKPPEPALRVYDMEARNSSLGRENAHLKEKLAKAEEMGLILKRANNNLEATILDLQNNLSSAKRSSGDEEELAPGFNMCMDKSNGVTVDILGCINLANEYIDKKLNDAYRKLLKACDYPGNDVKACTGKIKTMEQNWIRFRDAATDIMALVDFKGLGEGTMYRIISFEFYVIESKKHLQKLNDMLNNISNG